MLLPNPLVIYTKSPGGNTKDAPGPVRFTSCYKSGTITLSYSPLGGDGKPSSSIKHSFELGPRRIVKAIKTLFRQADVVISFPDAPLVIRVRLASDFEQAVWVSTLSSSSSHHTRECIKALCSSALLLYAGYTATWPGDGGGRMMEEIDRSVIDNILAANSVLSSNQTEAYHVLSSGGYAPLAVAVEQQVEDLTVHDTTLEALRRGLLAHSGRRRASNAPHLRLSEV